MDPRISASACAWRLASRLRIQSTKPTTARMPRAPSPTSIVGPKPLENVAEQVVTEPEDGRPDDPACRVEDEEARPRHPIRSGEEGSVRPEDRDEPPPEHDLAAVMTEEPDPDPQPAFVEAHLVAVLQEYLRTAVAADREADVVSDDRGGGRDDDHLLDLELPRRAGVERRRDERGLSRQRQAEALAHHEDEDDDVAVRREPALDRVRGDEEAASVTLPSSPLAHPAGYGEPVIEARDLTKDYGEKRAVDGLSFTVQPGVVTGFLGPNGSGKSTTMRLILGLDAPKQG